jgi:ADP-heptose:LPS heptosyltransferase
MTRAPSEQDPLPDGARVLMIRLSALGDVLFALETVAALKQARSDVRIDFLVEDRFAGLLAGHPQIERVLVYPRRQKFRIPGSLLRLCRTRYDAVLDLHGILKSALHVAFARSPRKLGFAPPGSREGAHWFYRTAVRLPEPLPHRAERGAFLLRALGIEAQPAAPVLAWPRPSVDPWAGAGRPRIVLHPGTSAFAKFKRWPAERFGVLAARLLGRGLCVAVSFGPGERELADIVCRAAPGVRTIDGAALGLDGLGAALQQADLVVAADTGPLHLAAAAGVPVVALFGPKDPDLYGPRAHGDARHHVLFADVPCRPCRRRDCASPQCVLGLEVDAVEQAVLQALAVAA